MLIIEECYKKRGMVRLVMMRTLLHILRIIQM